MVNPESSFCELILKCMQDIVSFAIFFFLTSRFVLFPVVTDFITLLLEDAHR